MKRCFAAILAILYVTTSLGAIIEVHYCMGEFIEWSVKDQKNEKCSNCGMKKSSGVSQGCCKDEQKRVNLDQHNVTGLVRLTIEKTNFHSFFHVIFETIEKDDNVISFQYNLNNSPPGSEFYTIYILNSAYLI